MQVDILGYKIELQILILICLLYIIILLNLIYSCIKVKGMNILLQEGFKSVKENFYTS